MSQTQIATVTSPGLNLHESAHGASTIKDTLTLGDTIAVDDHSRNWVHGRVVGTKSGKGLGQVGWVDSNFVSLSNVYDPLTPKKGGAIGLSTMLIGLVIVILSALAWLFIPA